MKTLLFKIQGIAEADPTTVSTWFRQSLPDYEVHKSGHQTIVAYQGGWWYRGETTIEPDPRGTRISYQVFNVATSLRWAVPLANRFFIGAHAQYTQAFTASLARLATALETRAYVIG